MYILFISRFCCCITVRTSCASSPGPRVRPAGGGANFINISYECIICIKILLLRYFRISCDPSPGPEIYKCIYVNIPVLIILGHPAGPGSARAVHKYVYISINSFITFLDFRRLGAGPRVRAGAGAKYMIIYIITYRYYEINILLLYWY